MTPEEYNNAALAAIAEHLPGCRVSFQSRLRPVPEPAVVDVVVPSLGSTYLHAGWWGDLRKPDLMAQTVELMRHRVFTKIVNKRLTPLQPKEIAALFGDIFDPFARAYARATAAGIAEDVACKRRSIEQDLDTAKQRHAEACAAADLRAQIGRSYLEILEPTP
jgi:hypothetical protein